MVTMVTKTILTLFGIISSFLPAQVWFNVKENAKYVKEWHNLWS